MDKHWQPGWYTADHESTWSRIKEAVARDWEQTKHDLHLPGGHELNQKIGDTIAQAAGKETIPARDELNPPEVVGSLEEDEIPLRYGYAARGHFLGGWTEETEAKLRDEWERGRGATGRAWGDVRAAVRHGWDRAKS